MSDVGSGSAGPASSPGAPTAMPNDDPSASASAHAGVGAGVVPAPSATTLRPEVVQSALTFLRHPSVATAPLSQRVAFLESKGLSSSEVDAALARAGSVPATYGGAGYAAPAPGAGGPYTGYAPAAPPGARTQGDWRDWFIMSVVGGGVGYGLYALGKRWLYPYLQPPSSSALEADLAALNARYDAVEKQLASLDAATAAAKAGLDAQQALVQAATRDVHDALKEADKREAQRDQDVRQLQRQVDDVHAQLNRMFDAHKEAQKAALEGITSEVKSLKTLFVSRTAAPASPAGGIASPSSTGYAPPRPTMPRPSVPSWQLEKPAAPSIPAWQLAGAEENKPDTPAATATATGTGTENNGVDTATPEQQGTAPAASSTAAEPPKPTIPAWQLESAPSPAPSPASASASASAPANQEASSKSFPGTADGRDPAEA